MPTRYLLHATISRSHVFMFFLKSYAQLVSMPSKKEEILSSENVNTNSTNLSFLDFQTSTQNCSTIAPMKGNLSVESNP